MGFNSAFKGLILKGSLLRNDFCSDDAQSFSLILELHFHVQSVSP